MYQDVSEVRPSGELSIRDALTTVELAGTSEVGGTTIQGVAPLRDQPKQRLEFQSYSVYDNLNNCSEDENVKFKTKQTDNGVLPLTVDVDMVSPWELRDQAGHHSNCVTVEQNTSNMSVCGCNQQSPHLDTSYWRQVNSPQLRSFQQNSQHIVTSYLNQRQVAQLSHSLPLTDGNSPLSDQNSPPLRYSPRGDQNSPCLKYSPRSDQNSPHLRYSPKTDQKYSLGCYNRNALPSGDCTQVVTIDSASNRKNEQKD